VHGAATHIFKSRRSFSFGFHGSYRKNCRIGYRCLVEMCMLTLFYPIMSSHAGQNRTRIKEKTNYFWYTEQKVLVSVVRIIDNNAKV
jgi:hypothetical protein